MYPSCTSMAWCSVGVVWGRPLPCVRENAHYLYKERGAHTVSMVCGAAFAVVCIQHPSTYMPASTRKLSSLDYRMFSSLLFWHTHSEHAHACMAYLSCQRKSPGAQTTRLLPRLNMPDYSSQSAIVLAAEGSEPTCERRKMRTKTTQKKARDHSSSHVSKYGFERATSATTDRIDSYLACLVILTVTMAMLIRGEEA